VLRGWLRFGQGGGMHGRVPRLFFVASDSRVMAAISAMSSRPSLLVSYLVSLPVALTVDMLSIN